MKTLLVMLKFAVKKVCKREWVIRSLFEYIDLAAYVLLRTRCKKRGRLMKLCEVRPTESAIQQRFRHALLGHYEKDIGHSKIPVISSQ
jgi:hypothetical protein